MSGALDTGTAGTGPLGLTLIDGRPGEQLPVADRAVQYGDGLFETITCRGGQARWLELHLQRLRWGCERLRLAFLDYERLAGEVAMLASWQPQCIVKVIVSRGVATRRGYQPSGTERPTRIVSRHEWPLETGEPRPLQVALSPVPLGTNSWLAGLKHLNRLEQVLAQLARPDGIDEVLMLSSTGQVIGGSLTNVFFADDGGLFTPDLTQCGVAGVMRRRVLESAGQVLGGAQREGAGREGAGRGPESESSSRTASAVPLTIRAVSPEELGSVREAFLTNVRWGVRSIGKLDGRALPSDDYAQRVRRCMDVAGG